MEGRLREVPPSDHDLRVMLCPERTGITFGEEGIVVSGHLYMSDRLWELGDEPTAIKVGAWNLNAISVRGADGLWVEVLTCDDEMPSSLSQTEMLFAQVMARTADSLDLDEHEVYYDALTWLRVYPFPVPEPLPALLKRKKKDRSAARMPRISYSRRPGRSVSIQSFSFDVQAHTPGQRPGEQRGGVTIYLAVDVATGYVLSLKATDEPGVEAALDLLSRIMRDRVAWGLECGAYYHWDGVLTPSQVIVEAESVFDSSRVQEALHRLRIGYEDGLANCFVDLRSLLADEVVVAPPPGGGDMYVLERCLVRIICDQYHTTPQLRLGGLTPIQAFARGVELYGTQAPPSVTALREALGHDFEAVIAEGGVEIEGQFYNSPSLQALRTQRAGKTAQFRFDPLDLTTISVLPGEGAVFDVLAHIEHWEDVPHVGELISWTLDDLCMMREILAEKAKPVVVRPADKRRPVRARRSA